MSVNKMLAMGASAVACMAFFYAAATVVKDSVDNRPRIEKLEDRYNAHIEGKWKEWQMEQQQRQAAPPYPPQYSYPYPPQPMPVPPPQPRRPHKRRMSC